MCGVVLIKTHRRGSSRRRSWAPSSPPLSPFVHVRGNRALLACVPYRSCFSRGLTLSRDSLFQYKMVAQG